MTGPASILDKPVAIVGAGAWGTALANAVARAGRDTLLLARDADTIGRQRQSPRLPGVTLEPSIRVSADAASLAGCDLVLLAVPAQAMRGALAPLVPVLPRDCVVMACAKGIERGTHLFMTQVIADIAPSAIPAILSGPSFAEDVARGLPTAVTLACADEARASAMCQAIGSAPFRPYHTTDIRGVEIGGAAKNVLAIAAGIVAGRQLGASALAALTTRGFAELQRFGRSFGARAETLAGLSGLGDLILTCSSPQSRNFSFGVALGRGEALTEAGHGKLAEGVFTAQVLVELADAQGVDMPIARAVAGIVTQRIDVDAAIQALLSRPFRSESEDVRGPLQD